MQIHLDALGGAAGNMFIAALLHAFPEQEAALKIAVRAVGAVDCELAAYNDGTLIGARFTVGGSDDGHRHVRWADIRQRIRESALRPETKTHAIGIFQLLADAEAQVHGIDVEEVTFHEVGAIDSIADIVGAAFLVDALKAERWSVSELPLGGGRIKTAHGPLPAPAPAAALLLSGFAMVDDGIPGERVTPTGAAILRYLKCNGASAAGALQRTGVGFGTRRLPGISNCLRALVFENAAAPPATRRLAQIEFEIDDQTAEDLAIGLQRVGACEGVLDVLQMPVFGKKSRAATHVRVLAQAEFVKSAIEACLRETSTIGLRWQMLQSIALPRQLARVRVGEQEVSVKIVERPGAVATAKAESADLAGDLAARAKLRQAAEANALDAPAALPVSE